MEGEFVPTRGLNPVALEQRLANMERAGNMERTGINRSHDGRAAGRRKPNSGTRSRHGQHVAQPIPARARAGSNHRRRTTVPCPCWATAF